MKEKCKGICLGMMHEGKMYPPDKIPKELREQYFSNPIKKHYSTRPLKAG